MMDFSKMSIEKMVELFELTTNLNDENIPTMRGLLMEEIEKRNPEDYNRWLEEDAEDANLRNYVCCREDNFADEMVTVLVEGIICKQVTNIQAMDMIWDAELNTKEHPVRVFNKHGKEIEW